MKEVLLEIWLSKASIIHVYIPYIVTLDYRSSLVARSSIFIYRYAFAIGLIIDLNTAVPNVSKGETTHKTGYTPRIFGN